MQENNEANKSEAALREERILNFWHKDQTFKKSLEQSEGKKEFIFYEGPPTANGRPGIHHLEARAFKDAIPRYKTMRGYHVRRKGGWDTHGLPVELQVEKKLNLNSKKAIEDYGIAKFNQECKESVWEYLDVWNKFTKRVGFWVDQEDPYVTYRNSYIESLWHIVKRVEERNLLYKDYKVVPWCPRCGTALSSHELAQGYEDVKDLSVYVKFKVKSLPDAFVQVLGSPKAQPDHSHKHTAEGNTYILAWTTTPWTLPGNVALAIGKDIAYVKVKLGEEFYILAKDRLSIIEGEYEIVSEFKGKDLIGMEYEPLYPFLANSLEPSALEPAYKLYEADFVSTLDGTGVVHTAVMYGQDDFELGTKVGLPKHHLVGLDGKFLPGTGIFEGRFVRDEDVAVDVIKDLAGRNLLLKKEKYEHSYPHCWRCKTALIYYARDSWYIRVSDPEIKNKMISENKEIAWEPEHIRDGRFGEWLREIKDWAISRERYWGTPLPVWTCESCNTREVIGSREELKAKTKKSGNRYFVMRHGQADNNVATGAFDEEYENQAKLTEKGREQARASAKKFKEKVDVVISSTLPRARETAQIFCEETGFPVDKIIYEEQVREWDISSAFAGKDRREVLKYYDQEYLDHPDEDLPGGESFAQVIRRMGKFIYGLEEKYANKNIFIVGHGSATDALSFVVQGWQLDRLTSKNNPFQMLWNAEIREFNFVPLAHDTNYELDLHRPYIDAVPLICTRSTSSGQACEGKLVRTPEVMDVWFDSGAMPFAQDNYPFKNKSWVDGPGYPADFISEAIDQTRGWFYTLHAVGALMGRGKAFKNVICLGHLMDAEGKKMSKSLGNIVDPWEMIEKYGVDTLRLWMYSVNQPGESKNFDEKTVSLLHNQVFGLLYNVLAFYELYPIPEQARYGAGRDRPRPKHVLDKWILARLDELIDESTDKLENYKLLEPVRGIKDFINDLSTWYLRRSRERIKEEAANPAPEQARYEARQTLYFVLKTLAKLLAPFAPFAAEDIWQKLSAKGGSALGGKNENDVESVHLESWPKSKMFKFGDEKILKEMKLTREVVSSLLKERQQQNIPVRQPLQSATGSVLGEKYVEIVKEEVNVKKYSGVGELGLDTEITSELKEEGNYRELVRALQEMRKGAGLTPRDTIELVIETNNEGKQLIQKFEADLKKTVLVSDLSFDSNEGKQVSIDNLDFKVKIKK